MNPINEITNMYGIDTTKLKEWLKANVVLLIVCLVIGFSAGWFRAEQNLEMDCKYAKAVRIGTSAFRCERIL